MSQAAIDDVVEGCKTVFSHTTQRLQSGVHARLATLGIDETAYDDLISVAYAANYRPVRIIDLAPTHYRPPLRERNDGTEHAQNRPRARCH